LSLSVFLVILLVGVAIPGYLEYSVYREVSAPFETLKDLGTKNAQVIYIAGLTDFVKNVTYTFADASAG